MSHFRLLPLATALLLFAGCSGDTKVSDQPDGFVQAVHQTLKEAKPEFVWQAMPASYRSDVGDVVHQFAGNMDQEVYEKGFSLARKVIDVVDKKRDMIFAHPMVAFMIMDKKDDIEKNLPSALKAVRTILESEISTLDGLKGLDLDAFVKETLSEAFAPLLELAQKSEGAIPSQWLEGTMKTTVVEQGDGKATVKVEVEGQPTETLDVVKVEGVWIPAEMAADWAGMMQEARAQLGAFKIEPAEKAEIMAAMAAAEGMLDKLLSANSAEEFGAAMAEAMQMGEKLGGG